MPTTPPHNTPHASRPHTNHPLPTTIWLPSPDEPHAAPAPGTVLPDWAIERIRTVFTTRAGQLPAPLLKFTVQDTEPGMDARTPVITYADRANLAHVPTAHLLEAFTEILAQCRTMLRPAAPPSSPPAPGANAANSSTCPPPSSPPANPPASSPPNAASPPRRHPQQPPHHPPLVLPDEERQPRPTARHPPSPSSNTKTSSSSPGPQPGRAGRARRAPTRRARQPSVAEPAPSELAVATADRTDTTVERRAPHQALHREPIVSLPTPSHPVKRQRVRWPAPPRGSTAGWRPSKLRPVRRAFLPPVHPRRERTGHQSPRHTRRVGECGNWWRDRF